MSGISATERAVQGFRALVRPEVWSALVQAGAHREYEPGQRLFSQGDQSGWLLVLVAGRVKVSYAERAGDELLLAVRGPGDLIGEFSGRDDAPRSATIQTLEHCVAYALPQDRFADFLRTHRIYRELDRYLMAKVRQSAAHTWRLAHQPTAARLASLLLEVLASAGPEHPSPARIPMSQAELAVALGLARSSVASTLARWRREGVVETGRAHIVLLDVEAIEREAARV
ncbi:Crp/Fnr family transcriptional regulator [Fodinicola feengrottensis]|uniref:Crp/Fnr family transcriptional regulator n=1 Tax=Fodinicola feengrottensis TaxID=435914 RepID=UPI0031E23EA0